MRNGLVCEREEKSKKNKNVSKAMCYGPVGVP